MRSPASANPTPEQSALSSFDYKGWREYFILTVLRVACVAGVALIAISFPTASYSDRILFVSLYIILLGITLIKTPYVIRASSLLIISFVVGVNSILSWGPWLDGNIFFIGFITLTALLFDKRVDLLAFSASIISFVGVAFLQLTGSITFNAEGVPATSLFDWAAYIGNYALVSAIVLFAVNQLKGAFSRVLQEVQVTLDLLTNERVQLEERIQERTEELETKTAQLRSSTTVARIVAEIQNIGELMETVTNLTSEQFGYYHVGLYLLDDGKRNAFLQAASSATGKQLIGQGFRIEPDRRNALHLVIEQKRVYIASDIGDASFIREANFPLTRSRMMLPLAVRGEVIGVLDMHSEQPQAFSAQDAEVMQTLADLIAISIDNVRLINETKILISQLELNTSLQTRQTWSNLTSGRSNAYQYTPAGVRPIFPANKKDEENGLRVPLILHGQRIGTIKLLRKGSMSTWSEREQNLIEKIADQVALALENSRLVEEAQRAAQRDKMIANVSSRVRETLDIESVVRTAATELRRVFDLKEAEITIGTTPAPSSSTKKQINPLKR